MYDCYIPANFVCGGYTVFTLSVRVCVRPSVRLSVRLSVTFCFLEESLLDFHQTLQTCLYMQDKYFRQKRKETGANSIRVISLCSSKWLLI